MNILGISEGFHDAAACVLKNNKIMFASQAERFSGVKNDKWIHSSQLPKTKSTPKHKYVYVLYTNRSVFEKNKGPCQG